MLRKVFAGPVQLGLVAVRDANTAQGVIRHHEGRYAAVEREGADVGHDPFRQTLRPAGLDVGVVARPSTATKIWVGRASPILESVTGIVCPQ